MFAKILVANRGEIACRIIRTARKMGMRTVSIFSEADAAAMHVTMADEAQFVGPPSPRESYLNIDRVIEAARRSGADAVHPGYGFLSENADFADACAAAELVFIGPPAKAIRAMGSKAAAKTLMEASGVPLVPGYHGADQDEQRLGEECRRIGYPVLIKASAGGGGKGMRVVERAEAFAAALASAKRESKSAFGDDRVLIEKYLTAPHHIEIQVFADQHGRVVHLFERDCSVQRRHQKVVEEAPAPNMSESRRRAMGEAAVAAARAVGYVGAGTVEFIAEGDAFYFMEMNTRLQVEHPVTEMITGTDLVEWQIRVAAGEPLPLRQEEIGIHGHAVEARLYAEDPGRDFLPVTGTLHYLRAPESSRELRIDTGVREGDSVSIHYDPMIAKVIAWGEDREEALRRLATALARYRIAGFTTNRDFLVRLLRHPAFVRGDFDTGFIERHRPQLIPISASAPRTAKAAAALTVLIDQAEKACEAGALSGDIYSPWLRRDGWRLSGDSYEDISWRDGDAIRSMRAHYRDSHYELEFDGENSIAHVVRDTSGELAVTLDGTRRTMTVVRRGDEITVVCEDGTWIFSLIDPLAPTSAAETVDGTLTAPMPGKVSQILVATGDSVVRGQSLMIIEAMKMEHTIAAPAEGSIERVNFSVGDLVEEGAELIVISAGE